MTSTQPKSFKHASFQGQIGIARDDITPPVGIYARNWGAAKHDVANSIHRPLTLTVLAIAAAAETTEVDSKPLILVDADLGWWKTPSTFHEFHQRVVTALALDPTRFIFALSHTHAGPPLMQPDPSLPGSDLLRLWMDSLLETTIQTIRQACNSKFPATLDWHDGQCALASQRDLPDPRVDSTLDSSSSNPDDKQAHYLCGYNPLGTPDQTLVLGRISDAQGTIRGTLVNYACHPTTLAADNTAISPDYVGAMRDTLEQATSAPALFLLGMCGDLAPRFQYVGDSSVADRHGRQLGYSALATLNDMEPVGRSLDFCSVLESGAPLAVWQHKPQKMSQHLQATQLDVPLALKPWPTADELEQQRLACSDRALEERLRRRRDIRRGIGDGDSYEISLYAWRIGDAVLVGSCCEPYSWLQQELRRRFAENTLICMNLINGSIGYLPPAELYDSNVYPVWQTPFERGSLERVLESCTGIIKNVLNR